MEAAGPMNNTNRTQAVALGPTSNHRGNRIVISGGGRPGRKRLALYRNSDSYVNWLEAIDALASSTQSNIAHIPRMMKEHTYSSITRPASRVLPARPRANSANR